MIMWGWKMGQATTTAEQGSPCIMLFQNSVDSHYLLDACTESKIEAESILTEDAIDLRATKFRTPLPI